MFSISRINSNNSEFSIATKDGIPNHFIRKKKNTMHQQRPVSTSNRNKPQKLKVSKIQEKIATKKIVKISTITRTGYQIISFRKMHMKA